MMKQKRLLNRSAKAMLSMIMAMMVVLTAMWTPIAAKADEDASVTYEGGAESFVFLPGSKYSPTSLFPNFENAMPGDVLTQEITVKNNKAGVDYVKIYLKAVPHDDTENPLSEKVAATETVASMTEFLSQLSMTVKNGSEVIFDASPAETAGLTDYVLLGSFAQGESTTLTVELSVPIELGNEYANRVGEVDWVFLAEEMYGEAHIDLTMTETSTPADGTSYKEGEEVTFDLTVTNNGNVTLTDVTVTDPLTGDTFTIDKLEPGESVTFSTTPYKVTAEDAKAGKIHNEATAKGTPDNPDLEDVTATASLDIGTGVEGSEPKTGDESQMTILVVLAACAAVALIVVIILRFRKGKKTDEEDEKAKV